MRFPISFYGKLVTIVLGFVCAAGWAGAVAPVADDVRVAVRSWLIQWFGTPAQFNRYVDQIWRERAASVNDLGTYETAMAYEHAVAACRELARRNPAMADAAIEMVRRECLEPETLDNDKACPHMPGEVASADAKLHITTPESLGRGIGHDRY